MPFALQDPDAASDNDSRPIILALVEDGRVTKDFFDEEDSNLVSIRRVW